MPVSISKTSDDGYHRYGNDWWMQPGTPGALQYLALDPLYPTDYFIGHGHPERAGAESLVCYMIETHAALFGRPLESVLELGTGGGEITAELDRRGLDYLAVEGTAAGVARLKAIGIPDARVLHANLKFLPDIGRRFDLAMCTEVAEHIEPFFASQLVLACTAHSAAVWFSAADRNRRAHYHHINEQDISAWDNLFAHMGFGRRVELDGRHGRASRLYLKASIG